MFQNIACYYVFLDLAAYACKGDWSVIIGFILLSFLKNNVYACSLSVIRDGPSVQAFLEDNGQEQCDFCCEFFQDPCW